MKITKRRRQLLAGLLAAALVFTVGISGDSVVLAAEQSSGQKTEQSGAVKGSRPHTGIFGEVVCLGEVPFPEGKSIQKKADAGSFSRSSEESFDELGDQAGSLMNKEMEEYLSGSSADSAAEVEKISDDEEQKMLAGGFTDIHYKVTFDMTADDKLFEIPSDVDARRTTLMRWLYQASARYTSLCTLFSYIIYTYSTKNGKTYLSSLSAYTPVNQSELRATVAEFQNKFARLKAVPEADEEMTDAEKLLYIHDEIAAMADYDIEFSSTRDWLPIGTLLDKKGVCQSYALLFNLAAVGLGFESVVINSKTHAWNAVNLNGNWYYLDVTWDDPVGDNLPMDFVTHEYFLVQKSAFEDQHDMEAEYALCYGEILGQMGTAYDNYFPKKNNVTRQLCYLDGVWYYSAGSYLKTWDGESGSSVKYSELENDTNMKCDTFDGKLYYSGGRGLFIKGDPDEKLDADPIKDMVIRGDKLCYVTTGGAKRETDLEKKEEPTPTPSQTAEASPTPTPTQTAEVSPTPTPTQPSTQTPSPTPTQEVTPSPSQGTEVSPSPSQGAEESQTPAPTPTQTAEGSPSPLPSPGASTGKPSVTPANAPGGTQDSGSALARAKIKSLSNYKAKTVRCKLKKVAGAQGYQIYYAINKKFKKKKSVKVTGTKAILKKLKKKKTYYVKVRAFRRTGGKTIYGEWSPTKKIKIKR